ncbi:Hypothetical predicted protein, partial [Pelobates cultripes]
MNTWKGLPATRPPDPAPVTPDSTVTTKALKRDSWLNSRPPYCRPKSAEKSGDYQAEWGPWRPMQGSKPNKSPLYSRRSKICSTKTK